MKTLFLFVDMKSKKEAESPIQPVTHNGWLPSRSDASQLIKAGNGK